MPRFSTAAFLRSVLVLVGCWWATLSYTQAQGLPSGQGIVADTTEMRVLRQFFYATNGASWSSNKNWLNGTALSDAATWRGVQVQNGDVVGLSLSGNGLRGTLPAALGKLAALQALDLSKNQLGGQLPAEIGNWREIHLVHLESNSFSGPLPTGIGRWVRIQELAIQNNQLNGDLPDSLRNCIRLQSLFMGYNALTGSLQVLPYLSNLSRLSGENNRFSGVLPVGLGGVTSLTEIRLDNNQLNGPLPDSYGSLSNLKVLILAGNHLSGTVLAPILRLPQLTLLRLDGNDFTDIGSPSGSVYTLPVSVNVTGNLLDYGALEQLYRAATQPWVQTFDARGQRSPARVDTVSYQAGGVLDLIVNPARGNHIYHYQWQRLVGGQWVNMPGDTLASKHWAAANVAEQGTYRRAVHDRWFQDANVAPIELYSIRIYVDLQPYAPVARNRPADYNTGLPPATLSAAPDANAQNPGDVNYVRTWTPRVALTVLPVTGPAPTAAEAVQAQVATQYLDGLGQLIQTVQHRASPRGRDVVEPVIYDALGRKSKQYLPYADTAGTQRSTAQGYHYRALTDQQMFYYRTGPVSGGVGPLPANDPTLNVARTGRAFAETVYEASPLNRIQAQGAAGEAWQVTAGHVVERTERTNTAADSVLRFQPSDNQRSTDSGYLGFYATGELWATEVADAHGPNEYGAHGYRTIEWRDKEGHLVLRQVEASRVRTQLAGRQIGGGDPVDNMQVNTRWLRTAYAYDDFGHLRFVVQPEGTRRLLSLAVPVGGTAAWPVGVDPFVFRYRYDGRGRQIAKQIPGQDGEVQVIYDPLDRPVLVQDAAQRLRKEWSWTKYDVLGRVVLTGLVIRTDTSTSAGLQTLAAADTATTHQYEVRTANASLYPHYYTTDQAFPRLGQQGFGAGQVLSVTYYDDYNFDNDAQGIADAIYDTRSDAQFPNPGRPIANTQRTRGFVTRTKTRVLGVADNDAIQAAWLMTTTFYDERGRPIQVRMINARKGTDLITSQLDFTGKVLQSVAFHTGPNHTPVQVIDLFTYDHAGRLRTIRQQLPGEAQPTLISQRHYNELGQMTVDSLSTGRLFQPVKYAYNIRGWLTELNDPYYPAPGDLFNLSLHYETGFTPGYEQYNGNLTGQTWRGRDGVQRAYGYVYDPLNRLLQGDFAARTLNAPVGSANAWKAEEDNYRLSFVSYDDNGNVRTLRRRGLLAGGTHATPKQYGPIDALSYAYMGNRLQAVDDQVTTNQLPRPTGYNGAPTSLAGDFQEQGVRQTTEYEYDANGSLIVDRNKGITGITYNHLSLPRQIRFGTAADSVVFRYSATGQKIAKLVYQTGRSVQRTDYLGAYQYEGDTLRFFPHGAGRVLYFVSRDAAGQPSIRYEREFSLKDHLGNMRLAYRAGKVRRDSASLESDAASHGRESHQFDSLSVSSPIASNVGSGAARTGSYVARLNAGGSAPQPLGPLKQLAVQNGDTVTVTAYGLYPQAGQTNFWFSLASFITGLLHPANNPGMGLDPTRGRAGLPLLQVGVAAGLTAIPQLNAGVPKGYLRVLVFNADSALVSQQMQQLTSAALNNYQRLRLRVVVPQDGYVSAYVGNESDVDVYFDDITVELRQGLQVQETQYDPTGLELAGVTGTTPGLKSLSQYKFNGKEFQTDLGLNWTQLDWRMFDPQLNHLPVVDPEVENEQESMSPYIFGFDNAVRFNDPDGRAPEAQGPGDPTPYVGQNPMYYVGTFGLGVFQGPAQTIDKFFLFFGNSNTQTVLETPRGEVAGFGVKASTVIETKAETKIQPTFTSFFSMNSTNKPQGGLVKVSTSTKVSSVTKGEASTKIRGADVKLSAAQKFDLKTGASSTQVEGSVGVGVKKGAASATVSAESERKGKTTVKAGLKVEMQTAERRKSSVSMGIGFGL